MHPNCQACEYEKPQKRTFDARYHNPDKSRPKLRKFGMNERNLTSEQLVQFGFRKAEVERKVRKIGGPNPYQRDNSRYTLLDPIRSLLRPIQLDCFGARLNDQAKVSK